MIPIINNILYSFSNIPEIVLQHFFEIIFYFHCFTFKQTWFSVFFFFFDFLLFSNSSTHFSYWFVKTAAENATLYCFSSSPFFTNSLISSLIPFLAIYKQKGVLKCLHFSSVFSKRCPKAILSSKLKSIMWNCCGWVAYFSQSSKSFN